MDLIEQRLKEKGIACIRRASNQFDYVFEQERNDEKEDDGVPSIQVITRENIMKRLNKNYKMNRFEKRTACDVVRRRFSQEVRVEAKRRGYEDRLKNVTRAARAIFRGDTPRN